MADVGHELAAIRFVVVSKSRRMFPSLLRSLKKRSIEILFIFVFNRNQRKKWIQFVLNDIHPLMKHISERVTSL